MTANLPQSLNWKEIDLVLSELSLPGSLIQEIHQPSHDRFVLNLFRGERISPSSSHFPRACPGCTCSRKSCPIRRNRCGSPHFCGRTSAAAVSRRSRSYGRPRGAGARAAGQMRERQNPRKGRRPATGSFGLR